MCLAAWLWQSLPSYHLLLFLNRDEYHHRPTEAAGWWGEGGGERRTRILGGRDAVGGGTWLACSEDGRVAFITNFREPGSLPSAKTRGALPVRFLEGKKNPHEFAEEIVQEADQYNGFNLILADLRSRSMVYISNRPDGQPVSVQTVSPGLHVLSNGSLDTPWPKAQRLRKNLNELLYKHGDGDLKLEEATKQLLSDRLKADEDKLPDTGVDPHWEYQLSPIFVEADSKKGRYGTRSMAMISAKTTGEVTFYERYLECDEWKEHTIQYQIGNMPEIQNLL